MSCEGRIVSTERSGYLAKQIAIICIESSNTQYFLVTSEPSLLIIWGKREHFGAITITQINNRAYAEPITVLFSAFTLRPPFCILLWISEVIQKRGKRKTQTAQ